MAYHKLLGCLEFVVFCFIDDKSSVSLEESAAAHQARLARPEFEEVQVKTGEEDESNVFQVILIHDFSACRILVQIVV